MIRKANEQDMDTIFKIETDSFSDPYPEGLLKAFLYLPGIYLVALCQGAIVGYVIGVMKFASQGHIVSIAVAKAHQGEGVGKKLMLEAIDRLAKMDAKSVRLEVRESNTAAIELYMKLGFVETGKIERYYSDGESARVMYLNL
jgi:ribosomal-protein-alanine N-acetyltransferase